MNKPLIVKGDRTSHGGTVISADFTSDINGKYMARVGDMTVCPKCKGIFAITTGSSDLTDDNGNAYARDMDSTACGAKLLSSQRTTLWRNTSTLDDLHEEERNDAIEQAKKTASASESGICLDCLITAAAAGSATVIRE